MVWCCGSTHRGGDRPWARGLRAADCFFLSVVPCQRGFLPMLMGLAMFLSKHSFYWVITHPATLAERLLRVRPAPAAAGSGDGGAVPVQEPWWENAPAPTGRLLQSRSGTSPQRVLVPGPGEGSVAERTAVSLPSAGNWGPHLVVVRSYNILKWELELKRWCPGLKTLVYVGSHRELKAKRQVLQLH